MTVQHFLQAAYLFGLGLVSISRWTTVQQRGTRLMPLSHGATQIPGLRSAIWEMVVGSLRAGELARRSAGGREGASEAGPLSVTWPRPRIRGDDRLVPRDETSRPRYCWVSHGRPIQILPDIARVLAAAALSLGTGVR